MNKKISGYYVQAVLVFLVITLAVLGYVFWRQYRYIQHMQIIDTQRMQFSGLLRRGHLTAGDTSYIQPWMTFDYVSFAFRVPTDILKSGLGISDPQYPHISISRYARSSHQDTAALVGRVRGEVESYLMNASTSTATSTSAK
jgi:hypothetical protein